MTRPRRLPARQARLSKRTRRARRRETGVPFIGDARSERSCRPPGSTCARRSPVTASPPCFSGGTLHQVRGGPQQRKDPVQRACLAYATGVAAVEGHRHAAKRTSRGAMGTCYHTGVLASDWPSLPASSPAPTISARSRAHVPTKSRRSGYCLGHSSGSAKHPRCPGRGPASCFRKKGITASRQRSRRSRLS